MYYLIYTSFAATDLSESDLESLLLQSREWNDKFNITGMLYYFNQSFMQLIEGDEQNVKQLYQNILKDARHNNLMILSDGYITERYFPDWSMGHKTLKAEDVKTITNGETEQLGVINRKAVLRVFGIVFGEQ